MDPRVESDRLPAENRAARDVASESDPDVGGASSHIEMNCPVCENILRPVQAGEVTVDACVSGCGGLWFDAFELGKLERPEVLNTAVLIPINLAVRPDFEAPVEGKRRCPKCVDYFMMRHFFSRQRRVEVDECPQCGGYWLDAGELALIREELGERQPSPGGATPTGTSLFNDMPRESEDQLRRAQTVDQILRFCVMARQRPPEM